MRKKHLYGKFQFIVFLSAFTLTVIAFLKLTRRLLSRYINFSIDGRICDFGFDDLFYIDNDDDATGDKGSYIYEDTLPSGELF